MKEPVDVTPVLHKHRLVVAVLDVEVPILTRLRAVSEQRSPRSSGNMVLGGTTIKVTPKHDDDD